MTSQSLIYSHRWAYHWLMRGLYGRHFEDRYRAIAAHVPAGAEVIDVCAGDAYLYLAHLRHKPVSYVAVDASPQLVAWAQVRGVDARLIDVWSDDLPHGDSVIMQASLYQFLPHADRIVDKLLAAARRQVIIAEPVRNIADSDNPVLAVVGKRFTRPSGGQYAAQRFNRESFTSLCNSFAELQNLVDLPGGREMLAVFRGRATDRS